MTTMTLPTAQGASPASASAAAAAAAEGRRARQGSMRRLTSLGLLLCLGLALALALLAAPASAGAYNPPLGEDARLDQVDDYPEWYEVDPLTLGARDYILDTRYEKGVRGLPKKMKVTLEPTGFVRIASPKKQTSLFMGMWEPYTSLFKRTTTGFGLVFRRWKPDAEQDMEYVFFKMNFRPPLFQPCCMSFKVGEVYDEMGNRLGRFKARLPHNKALIDPTFRAHRSWIKQGFW